MAYQERQSTATSYLLRWDDKVEIVLKVRALGWNISRWNEETEWKGFWIRRFSSIIQQENLSSFCMSQLVNPIYVDIVYEVSK